MLLYMPFSFLAAISGLEKTDGQTPQATNEAL
jgi:hypothetical protein